MANEKKTFKVVALAIFSAERVYEVEAASEEEAYRLAEREFDKVSEEELAGEVTYADTEWSIAVD